MPVLVSTAADFHNEIRSYFGFGRLTETEIRELDDTRLPVYRNEFWTAKQRAGHSIHEISYRACYKPQLPAFFIRRFCAPGDRVYDPFMGRGTTLIEAQLHRCQALGNDVNPLSRILIAPRLNPPTPVAIEKRLKELRLPEAAIEDEDLLVFFEERTLRELYGWRAYFHEREKEDTLDTVDAWLRMVACNRLTGHSPGFFSVYTLPPNQATSVNAQRRINEKRNQSPEYRDTRTLILRKSRQLLKDSLPRHYRRSDAVLLTASADRTPEIPDDSVRLVVTSPPFLDTVDYLGDNWLRMWLCQAEFEPRNLWQLKSLDDWTGRMATVFHELRRILQPGGLVAFEVGEVRKGKLDLENEVIRAALPSGLAPECVLLHTQNFTKTANCWGVDNNARGTNSQRIVLLQNPE